ncbi:hypothetical protein A3Q56_00622 [Intoshia linei]|uniref:CDK5 regulatory subunit-associated protein 3 n=1 Tax=Intoshia linei TaxID=1819745 RepID=A0A177BBE0_9BILA|nr:hypothetical protein A3Q56_00622 [Intoshia linei]
MDEKRVPIHIHCNKLMDWLIQRNHCQCDWYKKIKQLENEKNIIFEEIKKDKTLQEALSKCQNSVIKYTNVNYNDFMELYKNLLETHYKEKNVFGQYTKKPMKNFYWCINEYVKNNVYLAEYSYHLTTNLNYKIPELKLIISTLQQDKTSTIHKINKLSLRDASISEKIEKLSIDYNFSNNESKKDIINQIENNVSLDNFKYFNLIMDLIEQLKVFVNTFNNYMNIVENYDKIFNIVDLLYNVKLLNYLTKNKNTTNLAYQNDKTNQDFEDINNTNDQDENIEIITLELEDLEMTQGKNMTVLDMLDNRNKLKIELKFIQNFIESFLYLKIKNPSFTINDCDQILKIKKELLESSQNLNISVLVKNVFDILQDDVFLRMIEIRSNLKCSQDVYNSLLSKKEEISSIRKKIELLRNQESKFNQEIITTKQEMTLVIAETINIKKLIERDVSKKYNDRNVSLIGEINNFVK